MRSITFPILFGASNALAAHLTPRIPLLPDPVTGCYSDETPCDNTCMPAGAVCCNDGSNTHCDAGQYCTATACCAEGKICDGSESLTLSSTFPSGSASSTGAEESGSVTCDAMTGGPGCQMVGVFTVITPTGTGTSMTATTTSGAQSPTTTSGTNTKAEAETTGASATASRTSTAGGARVTELAYSMMVVAAVAAAVL